MVINTNTVDDVSIQIGSFVIPCFGWDVDIGTYGQIGRAVCRTSITALRDAGINLTSLNAQAQAATVPTITSPGSNNIPVLISVNGNVIFGGYYLHGHYSFGMNTSTAEIYVRDYSCVLFDSKTSIADLQYQGLTINQLVTAICNLKGLNPQITSSVGAVVKVGDAFAQLGVSQGGVVMSTYPQSFWNLIVLLGRSVNAQVYTVPNITGTPNTTLFSNFAQPATPGTLVFEDVPSNPPVHNYYWKAPYQVVGPVPPLLQELEVLHQPQRNKSFAVVVKSHHQQSTQTYISTVSVVSEDTQTINSKTVRAGFYTGTGGAQIRSLLSNKALGIPVYEFRIDGLTASGAQAKAESIAQEIAAKLLVETLMIDFDFSILPGDQIIIHEETNNDLLGFAGQPLYITGVRHTFGFPQGEEVGTNGLQTVIKSLTLPPVINPIGGEDVANLLGGI